ncbi:hypothetical protein J7U46_18555 [Pelomonas sp. V22]|uniref:hypothetical protein n=1 Tax=Pelomonas sp. V22 TaxID=2822139 RepID=UPI0024A7D7E3|nr:hypothetical protein [Pelomonas sp. V22]MDI4635071.1 hypothetical protein [Pelomonas sp. V22]
MSNSTDTTQPSVRSAALPIVSKWPLLWPMLLVIVVPLIVSWFVYPETHLPPKFGVFPPVLVEPFPAFWLPYFLLVLAAVLVIAAFLIWPTRFGFQPPQPQPPRPLPVAFPAWFWAGAMLTVVFLAIMFGRALPWAYYAFSPLWWGFILVLDGLVYRRNAGRSLLSRKPKTLFISALVSVVGWGFFEYYDYFALGDWYYPNGAMPALSHATIVALFLIAYTTVWPALLEWYTLLQTFPTLAARYAVGPKLVLPSNLLIWGGLALCGALVVWPLPLFWVLWIGPMAVLMGLLQRLKIWTPIAALAEGNWTPAVLVALGSLFNGLFWEVWNWGSAHPDPSFATNPNYWVYNIPYVNVIHLFAEMPLLGFAGYLPFGILVWLVFIWAGQLCGFSTSLDLDD